MASEVASSEKYIATLVQGEYYAVRDIAFHKLHRVVINDDILERLDAHAVDKVGGEDGSVTLKDKFHIEAYDGPHPVGFHIDKFEDTQDEDRRVKNAVRQPARLPSGFRFPNQSVGRKAAPVEPEQAEEVVAPPVSTKQRLQEERTSPPSRNRQRLNAREG